MKIRNNKNFNVSLMAAHAGKGAPERIILVAGAMTEIDDAVWARFAKVAKGSIKSGAFTMVKAPAKTAEERAADKADELAKALAIVEAANAKEAAEASDEIDKAEKDLEIEEGKEAREADKVLLDKRAAELLSGSSETLLAGQEVINSKLETVEHTAELSLESAESMLSDEDLAKAKKKSTAAKTAATKAANKLAAAKVKVKPSKPVKAKVKGV